MENFYKKIMFIFGVLFMFSYGAALGGVALLTQLEGSVEYRSEGSEDWTVAQVEQQLNRKDHLRTGSDSMAVVEFNTGHEIEISAESSFEIRESNKAQTDLELFKGKLRSRVKELSKDESYEVQAPQAVTGVRGTDFSVEVVDNTTRVEVFEGKVLARELITGQSVEVSAGQYTSIESNQPPAAPRQLEPAEPAPQKTEAIEERDFGNIREEVRREMFEEISREAVLSRAAEEIKQAEYENGKVMIDVHGNRVRLEEYVVRLKENEFKYVVLNHRDERFDFGKIDFVFDSSLPGDLSRATENMFYSDNSEKPDWILTDLTSVISNTKDRVNEVATGGNMIQDSEDNWRHYFSDFTFSIKGFEKEEKVLWAREIYGGYGGAVYDDLTVEYEYLGGDDPEVEKKYPSGEESFHFYNRNTFADGTWISTEDYFIDDEGNIQSSSDLSDNFNSEIGGSFKEYLAGLNFERKYESSEFGDRDIDLVFSTKLILDAGMVSY